MLREGWPELDPAIRRVGAAAVHLAIHSSTQTSADDLPDFEEYLARKHPDLPAAAVSELRARLATLEGERVRENHAAGVEGTR